MEWKEWIGKRIFVRLMNGSIFSGDVIEVDDYSAKPLVWITIIDKFKKRVVFVHSQILEIKEERE